MDTTLNNVIALYDHDYARTKQKMHENREARRNVMMQLTRINKMKMKINAIVPKAFTFSTFGVFGEPNPRPTPPTGFTFGVFGEPHPRPTPPSVPVGSAFGVFGEPRPRPSPRGTAQHDFLLALKSMGSDMFHSLSDIFRHNPALQDAYRKSHGHQVMSMCRKGWIRRPDDVVWRRSAMYKITELGMALLNQRV